MLLMDLGSMWSLSKSTLHGPGDQKRQKESEDGEGTVYKKDVESGMRLWIETTECRRKVAAEYFNDGAACKG